MASDTTCYHYAGKIYCRACIVRMAPRARFEGDDPAGWPLARNDKARINPDRLDPYADFMGPYCLIATGDPICYRRISGPGFCASANQEEEVRRARRLSRATIETMLHDVEFCREQLKKMPYRRAKYSRVECALRRLDCLGGDIRQLLGEIDAEERAEAAVRGGAP